MRSWLLTLFSLPFFANSAFGWGCEGHQMIALIARAHLTPAASAAVDELLKENPIDPAVKRFCKDRPSDPMADSATWADDAKNIEKTGLWHYVDIPLTVKPGGRLTSWCPPIGPPVNRKERPGCVTNAIEYEWAILRDRSRTGGERATALRYIIHFVGDMHQPLHDSDNDDHGGNCTSIQFFTEGRPANLHAIWDYKLIERELAKKHMSQVEYARFLDEQLAGRWRNSGRGKIRVTAWAWQGNKLARAVTYGALKPSIPLERSGARANCSLEREKTAALHISIDEAYFDAAMPVINEQLAKAGVRLAMLLNRTF
ncbi:MAG TPA: S1/P1 nuclease [Bryobacteraceae bacterium]|nr:S1/P1 nuclease [Bryobacteraceae bacterium]